jgi:hypothetical protein
VRQLLKMSVNKERRNLESQPLVSPPCIASHELPEARESEYEKNNNDCSDQPDKVVHE